MKSENLYYKPQTARADRDTKFYTPCLNGFEALKESGLNEKRFVFMVIKIQQPFHERGMMNAWGVDRVNTCDLVVTERNGLACRTALLT